LVGVEGEAAILEKVDGREITVPFARLSKVDRLYVEARRDISEKHLPETFAAIVVGISDGDTVTVLINRRQFKIRLDAIDAPEIGQDFGSKSKSHLSALIFGKVITGKTLGQDKYDRNLCRLFVGDIAVNSEMIRSGLAWHYVEYSDDQELASLQSQAIAQRANIWSESGPIPPWEWRRWSGAQRKNWFESRTGGNATTLPAQNASPQAAASNPDTSSETSGSTSNKPADSASLDYWLNSNSNVRHNRGCRWFENTKQGRRCGPNEGRACGQCGG
jgi:endonuclease YncB( thermonuclease family)